MMKMASVRRFIQSRNRPATAKRQPPSAGGGTAEDARLPARGSATPARGAPAGGDDKLPDSPRERGLAGSPWTPMTAAVWGLFVLAIVYTLYFAADFFVPVTAAILLNILLSPVIRYLGRFKVPAAISAGAVVLALFVVLFGGFYSLAEPATDWLSRAPGILGEVQYKLEQLKRPVEEVQRATETVERATTVGRESDTPSEVTIKPPTLLERLVGTLKIVGLHLAITAFLLYFLLASEEMFKEKLVRVIPRLRDKKRAILITRDVEHDVCLYLFTVTAINIGLGVAIAVAMSIVGLPNPVLWGAMAAILNFVPYVGAVVGALSVGIVAMVTFDTLDRALIAPLAYMTLNILEGNLITPSILGRRLTLNPVVIFGAVTFWAWIWGIAGALMAVPILVSLKVLADHIDGLNPIGEFISGRRVDPSRAAKQSAMPDAKV